MAVRHSRLTARRAVAGLMVFGALLTTACAGQEGGVAVVSSTVSSPRSSSTPPTTPSTPTSPRAPAGGAVDGDVADVVPFDDPATQLRSAGDLVDYLLPGLSGDGVECTRDRLDAEAVLASPEPEDAPAVVDAVTGCVEAASIGVVFAMYAVGLAEDGATEFPDVADCARAAVETRPRRDVRTALLDLYSARMDLLGPPTSRVIAADYLRGTTECLDGVPVTTAGETIAVDTPPPSPVPDATPPPPPVSDPTPPPPPVPSPTPAAGGTRSVRWTLLHPGDCLPAPLEGDVVEVGVVTCDQPHALEVVGASFLTAAEAENGCRNLFRNYTGQDVEASTSVLDILEAAEPGGSLRVICLAAPASGGLVTGSLAQPR